MQSEVQPDRQEINKYIKLVLVGQSGVGKTNILSRYIENKFSYGTPTTVGLQFSEKYIKIDNEHLILQIWDTAGQQKFRALNKTFYNNSLGAMVIFDLTNPKTFNQLDRWIVQLRQNVSQQAVIILLLRYFYQLAINQISRGKLALRKPLIWLRDKIWGISRPVQHLLIANKIVERGHQINGYSNESTNKPIHIKPKSIISEKNKKNKKSKCC